MLTTSDLFSDSFNIDSTNYTISYNAPYVAFTLYIKR